MPPDVGRLLRSLCDFPNVQHLGFVELRPIDGAAHESFLAGLAQRVVPEHAPDPLRYFCFRIGTIP